MKWHEPNCCCEICRAKQPTRLKRKLSTEHKAKIAAANRGRKVSDETKLKMSRSRRKRTVKEKGISHIPLVRG